MWYYADNSRQVGPVDDAALDDLARQGVVKDSTLVWREGMAAWQPLGAVRPQSVPQSMPMGSVPSMGTAAASAPAQAPPAQPVSPQAAPLPGNETRYCAECGRGYPAHDLSMVGSVAVCGACRPAVMQRMSAAPPPAQAYAPPYGQPYGAAPGAAQAMMMGTRRYAGFWIRFVARLIDGLLVGIVSSVILLPLAALFGLGGAAGLSGLVNRDDTTAALAVLPAVFAFIGVTSIIRLVLFVGYEVYFLTTRGATPGKMALGLKVIRADGSPLSAGLATGRYFAMMLSAMIFFIGYIMAGFDPEKRALHDRLCETRVVYAR
jgi:uncharacterized RDD family membrane protein YckC